MDVLEERTAAADYLAHTAEDFWEVGASGRVYRRDEVIGILVTRGRVRGDEAWVVSEACCQVLGPNT